jgi:hypothetical protein
MTIDSLTIENSGEFCGGDLKALYEIKEGLEELNHTVAFYPQYYFIRAFNSLS